MTSSVGPLSPTDDCTSCYEQLPVEKLYAGPCEHAYCGDCLERIVRQWLEVKTGPPPMCCNKDFVFEDFKEKMNGELAEEFRQKKEEFDTVDPVYCPNRTCSAFMGAQHVLVVNATATCPVCTRVVCPNCTADSHPGDCVRDSSRDSMMELAEEEGYQTCKMCRRLVEHDEGCWHMK